MSFLLDTNVISEFARFAPNKHVDRWFSDQSTSELYLSTLTIAVTRQLIVVTRNIKDFARITDSVLDPFSEA